MKEKDLNIKYICDKTSLSENDELISIILDMIKESYKLSELWCDSRGKVRDLETQQKEFIKFLEYNWEQTQDIWYIKILQKYKEITGGKSE